ncbi:hypothetical protein ABWED_0401 [Acinetobacter lwoffii]|nr:hypothetical protein ABWED_0401 [Acinetobacter lwoffii]
MAHGYISIWSDQIFYPFISSLDLSQRKKVKELMQIFSQLFRFQ